MNSKPAPQKQPGSFIGSRLFQWLTDPRNNTADGITQTRIRGMLSLLIALIPITLLEAILLHAESERGYIFMPTLTGLLVSYFLYRNGKCDAGKWLLVAVLWLTAPFAFFGLQQQLSSLLVVALVQYPLMALLVAQHVLARKYVYGLFTLTIVFLLVMRISQNPTNSLLFSLLLGAFVASLSIIFAILSGADRQARRLAEADRAEREARYRAMTELVSDFVFKLRAQPDGDLIVEWTAGALEKVLGYDAQSTPEGSILSMIYPEDLPNVKAEIEKLEQGEQRNFETRIINKDNNVFWLQVYAYGEINPATGKLRAIYGAAQSIDQRKADQRALEVSEGRLRAIIDSNVMSVILMREEDGIVMMANQKAMTTMGYTADEFIGQPMIQKSVSLKDRRYIQSLMRNSDHMQDIEIQARRKDGQLLWMVVTMSRTIMDGVSMMLSSFFEITARKQTEDALREQQTRYETLVNSVDGVVWIADAITLEVEFMSKQIEVLTGYSRERFMREPGLWLSLIHPDDREHAAQTRIEAVQQSKGGFQQEYRMISADGRTIWVRDIVSLTQTDNHWIMSGLSINNTEAKEALIAEDEQRRLADGLRSTTALISRTLNLDEVLDRILEQLQVVIPSDSADIMLIEGRAGRLVRSRGYDGNKTMGFDIDDFLFPIFDMPTFQTMMSSGKPLILDDISSSPDWVEFGRTSWIQSTLGAPIRLEDSTIGFINLTSDRKYAFTKQHALILQTFADQVAIALRNARLYQRVSEHADDLQTQIKQSTSELELERQRISAILDSTSDGIVYSEDTVIRYVNRTLGNQTGYSAAELINQPILMIYHEGAESLSAQKALETVLQRVRTEGIWRGDVEIRRKDGTCFSASLAVSRIGDANSTPVRAVSTVRDISKEKGLQQQRSNLVAYASHELRTPITNLKTRLYLLRRRPEHLDQHLNVLDEVTERMKRLVEDLLDISRLERGVIPLYTRPINLNPHLQQIIDIQKPEADRKGLTLIYDEAPFPAFVNADAERLAQVITNLLTNAINYTPAGGIVRLVVAGDNATQQAVIQVQDTGIGIEQEHLAHIFQPFYRVVSHVSGTGLGLSIARQIVELHDGDLSVSSTPGEGSTFTIRLALAEPPLNGVNDFFHTDIQA